MNKLKSFEQFVNESNKFKGAQIFPNWLNSSDFGPIVRTVSDLKAGKTYFLLDLGVGDWHGEFIYQGFSGGNHMFNDSTGEVDPLQYTDSEMKEAIKDGEVYLQK